MKKILLIEDDAHVCSFVNQGLTENGYSVSITMDGNQGLNFVRQSDYDLIIIDIMLPGMNGLDVCKEIRKSNLQIPILFLTALNSTENVVLGLDSGADDYLSKPFKFIELLARIRTLLRRKVQADLVDQMNNSYEFGDLIVDDNMKTVSRKGENVLLTSTEYRLLIMFLKNPKRVLSRTDILDEVWGINYDIGTNVVDVYVNYLRKKLEKHGDRLIHTVVGMGYVLK